MKTRLKRTRVIAGLLIATGAVLLLGALPEISYASAIGYQYWGGFTANIAGQSVGIPAGQLTHVINGNGYHINWDAANFGSAGTLCDPSIRFTYGNGKYRVDGNVHWGCSHVGQWKYTLNWNSPRGSACAELWAKNWRVVVAKQCHYVHG